MAPEFGKCSVCGAAVSATADRCPSCGVQFAAAPEHVLTPRPLPPRHASSLPSKIVFVFAAIGVLTVALVTITLVSRGGEAGNPQVEGAALQDTPSPRPQARVLVEGNPGIQFSGSIGEVGRTHTVSGVTPNAFPLDGSGTYSAFIQKRGRDAALQMTVTIVCPNGERKSSSTNADFGVASVFGTCPK